MVCLRRCVPSREASIAAGVGHGEDEQSFSVVRRADFLRREQSRLNRVTKSLKLSVDDVEAERQVTTDILKEDAPWARLDDDAADVRPDVARIVRSSAMAGVAEGLAWVACSEDIHRAAPSSAAEGSDIAPHRRLSQETRFHRFDQMGDGEGFPLHHADEASTWKRQFKSEFESTPPSAEGEDVEVVRSGTYSHTYAASRCRWAAHRRSQLTVGVTTSRWSPLTQRVLRQRWSTCQPGRIAPFRTAMKMCARTTQLPILKLPYQALFPCPRERAPIHR